MIIPRRRNGTIASCEPCRKRKLRCDHGRPVCERCRQRGQESICIYHPAPLSQRSGLIIEDRSLRASTPSRPATSSYHARPRCESVLVSKLSVFNENTKFHPARKVNDFLTEATRERDTDSNLNPFSTQGRSIYDERIALVAEILQVLRDFETIRNLLTTYYSTSQASIIPSPLILSALPSLSESVILSLFDGGAEGNDQLSRLAEDVLISTSSQINVTATMSPSEFMHLYTGKNLRLEFLGIVFSVAARSCLIGLAQDGEQRDTFIQDLYCCSTICLRLARELTPLNDMLVWLGQDHLMLTACIEGDSSEDTWHRLGDLYADILGFGVYRDSFNTIDTPVFLTEGRRKVFAKAYHTDKYLATLFDRPPRLLKRHADSKLPLDLTDAEILASPSEIAKAQNSLSPSGWNQEGKFCPSTWTRVRCIIAEMLEEILDYKYRPMTGQNIANLKSIPERNRVIWESLPHHLHYDARCWTSGAHPQICFMLTIISVGFLHCEFQVFQTLEQIDAQSRQGLLKISLKMITLIEELGSFRRKAIYLHRRFSYIILRYGLSPAIVLTKAAHDLARDGSFASHFPAELSRSRLVHALYVFVSQLESISGPGEPNHEICAQTSKAIHRTLVELLDPPSSSAGPNHASPTTFTTLETFNSSMIVPTLFDANIWDGFDDFDYTSNVEQDNI